jgi:predicted ATP-grasp superfamily ATP-dependent carboligase
MKLCDGIVADPGTPEGVKVKALAVLIRAVKVCYEIVTDVEVELIEEQAEEIRRALEERRRGSQEPPPG